MEEFLNHLSVREIKKRLRRKNYHVGRLGHVYPDVRKLPEDYPWVFKTKSGSPPKKYKGCDWPVPCGYLFNSLELIGLELLNEDEASVAKYHEEIRELLQ